MNASCSNTHCLGKPKLPASHFPSTLSSKCGRGSGFPLFYDHSAGNSPSPGIALSFTPVPYLCLLSIKANKNFCHPGHPVSENVLSPEIQMQVSCKLFNIRSM